MFSCYLFLFGSVSNVCGLLGTDWSGFSDWWRRVKQTSDEGIESLKKPLRQELVGCGSLMHDCVHRLLKYAVYQAGSLVPTSPLWSSTYM
ncbi:hypothetical protein F5Y05DRAFT_393529 [Hypoxylon sp. FL0543]|nr:hypothetical protein F5Y05DRAFT_393529 [Hypoxylon sp. FL0543]